ncbi:hypothetical protein DFP72DRAFT_35594 [Ephemerocybe angulata]|uniref:Smr domain-containing protein n=1 Tax=Ephemerocybe angulata TaxID=980116 RepID=A0A8H6M9U7_9AGAR|nr:hypothetical protein DFP72DRAFT_35594 [Tulosesus angulatus]
MDIAFSIISGLFLRIASNGIHVDRLAKVSSALVGVWEGVVVHQMSSRSSSELDHYLAYGLRVLIDFVVSRDQTKAIMILVWTVLGAFASEFVTPRSVLRSSPSKRDRRSRSSRNRTSHTRRTVPHPGLASSNPPTANLPLFPPNARATPQFSVTKPPSPPSLFLGADSESLTPIPAPVHPLDLSPTRPPTGLASHLEKGEGPDSGANPSLPTPPQSQPSDGLEFGKTASPHRLSTIHEISSAAERTPQHAPAPAPVLSPPPQPQESNGSKESAKESVKESIKEGQSQVQSTNPSGATTPLPVPNFTMQGFSIGNAFDNSSTDAENDEMTTSTPLTAIPPAHAAMPIPNPSTSNWQPHIPEHPLGSTNTNYSTASVASPPWETDDALDELQTPPSHLSRVDASMAVDLDDPLSTPPFMSASTAMLSPLILEEDLSGSGVPLVSVIAGPIPSITQIQALGESAAATPVASLVTVRGALPSATAGAGPGPSTLLSLPSSLVPVTPESPLKKGKQLAEDPPSDPESVGSSVFSTPEPTVLTRKAERMRQDARDAEKEWSVLKEKHNEAVREGKTAEGFVLKRKMYAAEERARELHKKAAKRYFASLNELNPKKKENTIDVHGLRPGEAIDRTERALADAMENGVTTLKVIVGKGLHSIGGQPVLKNVVKQSLERQKIECKIDPKNTGVLLLTVPSA